MTDPTHSVSFTSPPSEHMIVFRRVEGPLWEAVDVKTGEVVGTWDKDARMYSWDRDETRRGYVINLLKTKGLK